MKETSLDAFKCLLITVAYYDAFEYPLTLFEIWKHQIDMTGDAHALTLREVMHTLETERVRKHIGCLKGFYFIRGRECLVRTRLRRDKIAVAKLRGVGRLAKWFRFIPFVRMVALTGSLAMRNSERSGDWDVLIVLRTGHIWTGRVILTGLLHFFGKRRHGKQCADRVCLNYWITTDSLEIINQDVFASGEYAFAVPLFREDWFRKFQDKNVWIKRFRPQYRTIKSVSSLLCAKDTTMARYICGMGEVILSDRWLEKKMASFQQRKIQSNPKSTLAGSFIVATHQRLIFLPHPKGPKEFDLLQQRLGEFESAT